MPIGVGTAVLGAGALSGASSLIGSGKSSKAATSAANAQVQAANNAIQAQTSIYNSNKGLLSPFVTAGANAQGELGYLLGIPGYGASTGFPSPGNPLTGAPLQGGGLVQSFQPTQGQLDQTPGYQFTLGQGEKAVTNSFAAQGLGSSGPALKGAANYAEGLASTTYQQQFNNYWSQLQNYYNMLTGQVGPAVTAGGAIAGVGATTSGQLANSITGAGAAQAGGIVGSTNALVGGLSGISGTAGNTALLYSLYNSGMFGGQGGGGGGNPLFSSDGNTPQSIVPLLTYAGGAGGPGG